ncbi:MAG: DNA polymerase III subunit beta [Defluviitaleaceae bacterium]|nr:DNA polymerase III subunit beta [Defluviitaleaceae bacterium]MCL2835933.1 DNA polymerase III subunit beta [Defluviitaleaceae bacterium]
MKLKCAKELLMEGINIVSKAVSGRSTLPILDCVLLAAEDGGFRLVGNDLEIGIETRVIEAEVAEAGMIALDAKVFADIVRRLPGDEVYVESMSNYVTLIRGGVAEFKILGSPGEEFPLLPEVEAEGGFEIFSGELRNMIRQTIFSVSADESKPAMTGELFTVEDGKLRVASVDGFRISVRYAEVDNKELNAGVIVPGKALGEIVKILDAGEKSITSVHFAPKHILFETDDARVVSRLIEGKFLDFESVFNTEGTTFMTVTSKELLDCIERASLISRETKKNPVKFTVDRENEKLVVESNTETGTFYEELAAEIDGLDMEISFNPRFMADVLKAIDEERVRLLFTTPLSPCIVKGIDSENHKYLVLPLRVKN